MAGFPLLLLLLLLLCGPGSHGFPAFPEARQEDVEMVKKYLENYYALKSEAPPATQLRSMAAMSDKLKEMQRFFGLKVTGKIDAETMRVVKSPRCGVSDMTGSAKAKRQTSRWRKNDLTYRIVNYTPYLSESVVDLSFEKAFMVWSDVVPLTFTRIYDGEADIMIGFYRGDHNCSLPFNGISLAHAFLPDSGYGGDMHFDIDQKWTDTTENYNLYLIAAHEVGHALGLEHSSDIGSLMYDTYQNFSGDIVLAQEDIDRIQAIYGSIPSSASPTGPPNPKLCDSNLTFDAATAYRGEMMFFNDSFFMLKIYPMREIQHYTIDVFCQDLPSGLDAVYEFPGADELRFFKGKQYWVVELNNLTASNPRDIYSDFGFPKNVTSIDAALFERRTGKTYFFIGQDYWRYDEYKRSMDAGYPKSIAHDFPGIDQKIDAAFPKDGFFYFFCGTTQYKFDPQKKQIQSSSSANSWFDC